MEKPLVIQSDRSLLLDVHNPQAQQCRNDIVPFCELVKAPEHLHTYTISSLSLWNASSAGLPASAVIERLEKWSRYGIPATVLEFIRTAGERFGCLVLYPYDDRRYALACSDSAAYTILAQTAGLKKLLIAQNIAQNENTDEKDTDGKYTFLIDKYNRGTVKLELIRLGYPVDDRVPLCTSQPVQINLRAQLRDYQQLAVDSVLGDRGPGTGYGTVVMPCGSGKTVTGIALMAALRTRTLILCPNIIAVRQWIHELEQKSDIDMSLVGEYSGEKKEIRPVTVCTYQILTHRPNVEADFPHMKMITDGNWGLVIYDEVHLLPAPVFRVTAELQSVYRVGLTATLVREDGREEDVFSLVGPKRYDVPWTDLEQMGWIAKANCIEVGIPQDMETLVRYAASDKREKYRIASNNPLKLDVLDLLLQKHKGQGILVIGQYLDQLRQAAQRFGLPLITGSMSNSRRQELYNAFREGQVKVLAVSKVANFAVDLPDASVAIQLSGTFGSRQEEAQRLGRILRPKANPCYFYTLVTRYSVEEEFAANRRKFLVEQGYRYSVIDNQ